MSYKFYMCRPWWRTSEPLSLLRNFAGQAFLFYAEDDMSWKDKLLQLVQRKRAPQFASVEEVERAIGFDRIRSQVWSILDRMDMMGSSYHYLVDVYLDNGALYAIVTSQGKLYRSDIVVNGNEIEMGTLQPVVEMFETAETQERTVTRVYQQPDGRWRWFSISATAFLNRVGEIDSTALFDSFVSHAGKTGEYPYRTFVHQGEKFRTGQADFLARDGFCYITSGLYDQDNPLALVEISALQRNPSAWGESIGYLPTADPVMWEITRGINIPVYEHGIHVEISTVLESDAANWFTAVPYVTKERAMYDVVKNTLLRLAQDAGLSEEEQSQFLSEFEGRVDNTNDRAKQPGTVARSTKNTPPPAAAPVAAQAELVLDDLAVQVIVEHVLADPKLLEAVQRAIPAGGADLTAITQQLADMEAAINANFGNLNGRLEALEVDEVQRAQDMPAAAPTKVVYRPSAAPSQPSQQPVLTNGLFEDSSDELVVPGLEKLNRMSRTKAAAN